MDIHPTALVADGAELGVDVKIGPYCVIGPRVRLGDRCRLHSHVIVDGETTIGSDCEMFPFAVLGTMPQDKKLGSGGGGVLLVGNGNKIREHVTIHGGTPYGSGVTRIGNQNMFLAGAHVGHDATVGNNVVFTNGAAIAGHTIVEDNAVLGAMVGLHQFARVGRLAMIGAGAMVSRDAPPFALVQGDRARLVGVNVIGLKRQGWSAEDMAVVKRTFRQLFWRTATLQERTEAVREQFGGHPAVREILAFVAESRRGICRPRGKLDAGAERDAIEE
ncbi:MAG TPA: acyl-ACP--UDP-N-acetylglucosamine O-acyltransferase [Planctomycetota bacterium]|nr:acyl-ACP--UDP-N-acetylglucosamine O-acyltransferase [Planctomycetota bacterium]